MNNCRDLSKNFDATREEQEKTRGAEGGKLWGKVGAQFFLKLCENVAAKCLLKISQKSCGEFVAQNCGAVQILFKIATFAKNCAKRHGFIFAQKLCKTVAPQCLLKIARKKVLLDFGRAASAGFDCRPGF